MVEEDEFPEYDDEFDDTPPKKPQFPKRKPVEDEWDMQDVPTPPKKAVPQKKPIKKVEEEDEEEEPIKVRQEVKPAPEVQYVTVPRAVPQEMLLNELYDMLVEIKSLLEKRK